MMLHVLLLFSHLLSLSASIGTLYVTDRHSYNPESRWNSSDTATHGTKESGCIRKMAAAHNNFYRAATRRTGLDRGCTRLSDSPVIIRAVTIAVHVSDGGGGERG